MKEQPLQFLPTGQYGLCFGYSVIQVCSLNVPTIDRSPLMGPFLGVPSLLITLQIG